VDQVKLLTARCCCFIVARPPKNDKASLEPERLWPAGISRGTRDGRESVNGATGVGVASAVSLTFSEPVNPVTVGSGTVVVRANNLGVAGRMR
jgi:Bacterial Ig-like domain